MIPMIFHCINSIHPINSHYIYMCVCAHLANDIPLFLCVDICHYISHYSHATLGIFHIIIFDA